MAFSFLYLAVRALLGALLRSRRGLHVKDIELLVLRQELEILRRQVARPRLAKSDRALLAAAACHLPRSSRGVLLVTPRTLLRWHQGLVRWKWRQAPGRPGRPKLSAEVRELVLRLAREPTLGPSAHLRRAGQDRPPRLADQHPAAARPREAGADAAACRPELARVLANAGGEHRRVRFVHGRERFLAPLLRVVLHRPRQPARLARRLHREPERRVGDAAGALLILNRRHLERVLRIYVDDYNRERPHRALGLRPPERNEQHERSPIGEIRRRDRLGGLIHVTSAARRFAYALLAETEQYVRRRTSCGRGTCLPTVTPSRSMTASWRRFAFAVQPDATIALQDKCGAPASSRPHGSPLTGQTPHLPEDPPAQPGAERADVIASEPV